MQGRAQQQARSYIKRHLHQEERELEQLQLRGTSLSGHARCRG